MLIKFVYGAVSRTFVILCFMALVVGPNPANAMTRHQVSGAPGCTHYIGDNGSLGKYQDTANFVIQQYDKNYTGKKRIRANTYVWEQMLRMQNTTTDCPAVQKKVEEFFRIAIQKNEKSCAKLKSSACGPYDIWAQNLYEAAVKNGKKSFASTIKKYSSYVRNDTKAKNAAKTKADEAAKKKAAADKAKEEAEKAAKFKAAEEFIAKMDAENAAYKAKEKADEEKAAAKQAAIDDAFSVFDITAKEAAAKIKAAEEAAIKKNIKEAAKKKAAEEAAIIKGAAEVTLLMLEKYRSKTELQLNTQTYIDENGNKGTLWCNPGPCTPASALKHGWISGAGTFLPLDLVEAVTEAVTTDIETIDAPGIRSKIFDITLKTFKGAAETSNDSNLKSAAAMTTAQIKLNQEANEKSQEDRNDTPVVETEAPVVETEAPVGDPESAMVVGMNPP